MGARGGGHDEHLSAGGRHAALAELHRDAVPHEDAAELPGRVAQIPDPLPHRLLLPLPGSLRST